MTQNVLKNIKFEPDLSQLVKMFRMKEGSSGLDSLKQLVSESREIARPKGLFRVAFIDSKEDESVIIEGIQFSSRILRVNLEQANRVFAYAATCGKELDDWSETKKDLLTKYICDTLKEMALHSALAEVSRHLNDLYQPGPVSSMNPGSLENWPMSAQKDLFKLLEDPEEEIGVRLTESYLMIPTKSVSGIFFPTEETFQSCQLCPREKCSGRRAPYDKDLYDKKYRLLKTS